MKLLAKNVPAKSEWLFGDDLNKRIDNIRPYYQYQKYQGSKTGRNQQHYGSKNSQTFCSLEVANKAQQPVPQKLDNVTSMNIVHCNFVAGNIKHFYENWKKITNDHIILSIIQNGLKINFTEEPQYQNVSEVPHGMVETEIITQEVKKLLNKGVILE